MKEVELAHVTILAIQEVSATELEMTLAVHPDDDVYVMGKEEANTWIIHLNPEATEPDFLVPYPLYYSSVHNVWQRGDEIEQNFDGIWYLGRIHERMASETCWESFRVQWFNDETGSWDPFDPEEGFVSPWEFREAELGYAERREIKRRKRLDASAGSGSSTKSAAAAKKEAADKAAAKAAKAKRKAEKAAAIEKWRRDQAEKARKKKEEEARLAARAAEEAKKRAEEEAKRAEEERIRKEAEEKARKEAEEKARKEAEEAARIAEERRKKMEAEQAKVQAMLRKKAQEAAAAKKAEVASMLAARRAEEAAKAAAKEKEKKKQRWRYSMVCASNMNRSMEAHSVLQKKGFEVSSYGTGSQIKIPGPTRNEPNCYDFGEATYKDVFDDLVSKDEERYRRNGMLNMLERNIDTKRMPEKWQHCRYSDPELQVDVVICFEERVFEAVLADLLERGSESMDPVHVINIETPDTHQSAAVGGRTTLKLVTALEKVEDLEGDLEDVISQFQRANRISLLHSTMFY